MIVKNNIIKLPRGETGTFKYCGIQRSGEPYILSPMVHPDRATADRIDYAVLAFIVKTGTNGDIVLEKYYDLEAAPMFDGKTDYTRHGYHKFTSSIIDTETLKSGVSAALDEASNGIFKVYKDPITGGFVHVITTKDGSLELAPYSFNVVLSIDYNDTIELEPKEYIYELVAYFGNLTDAEITAMDTGDILTGFPLKSVVVKDVFINVQKFILEDSNNV